jgi:hypothetical protein
MSSQLFLSHLLLLLPSGLRSHQSTNHRSWDESLRTPGTHHYAHLLIITIHTWSSLPSSFLSLYMSLRFDSSPVAIVSVYRLVATWNCLVTAFVVLCNVSPAPASRPTALLLQFYNVENSQIKKTL